MIIEKKDGKHPRRPEKIRQCLEWLAINNHLYQKFYSNFETIMRYMDADANHTDGFKYFSASTFDSGKKGVSLEEQLGEEKMALLVPREDIEGRDWNMSEIPAAVCVERVCLEQALDVHRESTKVFYGQQFLEEKVFPVQYRYGTGGWYKKRNHTIGRQGLTSMRLDMLFDGFRRDPNYAFYQLDTSIKDRIGTYNHLTVKVKDLIEPLIAADLDPAADDPHSRYGKKVPCTIPNSQNFWQQKTMELIALSDRLQREPDFLITLSQNDNWPEIQEVKKGNAGKKT